MNASNIVPIIILLSVISIATVIYTSEHIETQNINTVTTPATTMTCTKTTSPHAEESQEMLKVEANGTTIRVSKFRITIYSEDGNVTLLVDMPNPCYTGSLEYLQENQTLILDIYSPPPDKICIQVIREVSFSTSVPQPLAEVPLLVRLDGKVVGELIIVLG